VTIFDIEGMMRGECLDEILDALKEQERQEAIKNLQL
jgi:protein subunit release factor A